jgi:lipopolysaccharide transport system ATP-binding protein
MSAKIAIHVRQLGKKYQLGAPQEQYRTLRDAVVNSLKTPLKAFHHAPPVEGFWALKDVSFEVEQGEVLGVIGRNGAGKSTLLKILSRITSPTEGTVELHGRIGSLLEVGTGFHPEMTGRENIFLNGSILGMKKNEIEQKFEEIVKFSEIEKFLDTPVKRYSSGMYVRLAFAVAAHLEPEILVVDEVLAVGDAAFQKKCLRKMGAVAEDGRTIMFVSHNMAAVQNLCSRGILIEKGKIFFEGITDQVIQKYNDSLQLFINSEKLADRKDRTGTGEIKISGITFKNEKGEVVQLLVSGQTYYIEFQYIANKKIQHSNIEFILSVYSQGSHIFTLSTNFVGKEISNIDKDGKIYCKITEFPLSPGIYTYNATCKIGNGISDWIINAGDFVVEGGDFYGTGNMPGLSHPGILLKQVWLLESEINLEK